MDGLNALLRRFFPWLYTPTPMRALVGSGVALLSIIGVYVSEYGFGIQPCELCYWQRWPYYIGVPLLALLLAFWKKLPAQVRLGLTLIGALIFVVSIGLGTYHAGIEYKLWAGPSSCTGLDTQLSFSDLNSIGAQNSVVPCDVVPFSIFGISLAGFNALGSLFISFMLFWSAFGQWARMKGKAD
jgi:disulfide bond formation protein DsbB